MASRMDSGLEASMQSLPAKDELQDDGESIRVYLRVRPPTERELAVASPKVVVAEGASVVVKSEPPRSFTFDVVLGETATQQEVFESVGRAVGSSCLAGYNGSVYVYGQTGAGKTHTMCGPINSVQSMQFDERRGIICRMLEFIFAEVARRGRDGSNNVEHRCRCSFLEIYKEQITDLLEPQNTNLQVREDLTRGVYVERLMEVAVSSLAEAFQVLWRGLRQRQVGSTHMNEKSSRSHAVFTLYILSTIGYFKKIGTDLLQLFPSIKASNPKSFDDQINAFTRGPGPPCVVENPCGFQVMFLQSCCGILQEAKRSHRAQLTGRLSNRNRLSRSDIGKSPEKASRLPEDGFLLGDFGMTPEQGRRPGMVAESWYNRGVTEVWTSNEDFMPFKKKTLKKSPSMVATGQRSAVRAAEETLGSSWPELGELGEMTEPVTEDNIMLSLRVVRGQDWQWGTLDCVRKSLFAVGRPL
eukprot:symbB.v1.2.003812.t1/scaffold192.1/size616647/23